MNRVDATSGPKVVALFHELNARHTRAAAGLLDDLCSDLGCMLQENSDDHDSINRLCDTLSQCFRPMDTNWPPDCHAWDAAYATFGRWLMRDLPQYRTAVIAITGWTDDRMAQCKSYFIDMVRITRDDWVRAANELDTNDGG